MLKFDPRSPDQGDAYETSLNRIRALAADMERIGQGTPVEELVGGPSPLLDQWSISERPAGCLVGLASGHPLLAGEDRPIMTSDLWLVSADLKWARTLSRWYRLGKPLGNAGLHS